VVLRIYFWWDFSEDQKIAKVAAHLLLVGVVYLLVCGVYLSNASNICFFGFFFRSFYLKKRW